jgi:hypothetical protein
MVLSILAITTGCRCPRMNTDAPSRARSVTVAAAASATTGSRYAISEGNGYGPPG